MEAAALISESNWSSFAFEDSELFMSQLFCNNPYPNLHDFDSNVAIPASFSWFSGDQDHASNSDSLCTSWPLDGSNTGHGQDSIKDICTLEEPNPSSEGLFLVLNEDQCMNAGGEPRIHFSEDIVPHNGLVFSSHKRKFQTSVADDHSVAEQPAINYQSEINPKKKAKISGHVSRHTKETFDLSTHLSINRTLTFRLKEMQRCLKCLAYLMKTMWLVRMARARAATPLRMIQMHQVSSMEGDQAPPQKGPWLSV